MEAICSLQLALVSFDLFIIFLQKVGAENEKENSVEAVEFDSNRPHPSVFWVRDRINRLDLPQFLLDYLLYSRRYNSTPASN